MASDIPRDLDLLDLIEKKSTFLFGPRSTGKTSLIKLQLGGDAYIIDLLSAANYLPLSQQPSELEAMIAARAARWVVIDEIQKLPELLDEVHRLIEAKGAHFLLTGSSARKLKRQHANMLGGRATQAMLFPLTWHELHGSQQFDLERYLRFGSIPRVYLAKAPADELFDYVDLYLKEEIQAEALVRNLPAFSRFLKLAALASGELLNYASIASDVALSAKTVKDYFEILDDTLLGFQLPPWRSGKSRKAVATSKHYLFDCGVIHALSGTKTLDRNSNVYGRCFEHFIIQEIRAYSSYRRRRWELSFWRTKHGDEVDLIIDDRLAIEIKATRQVSESDKKGLRRIADEQAWDKRLLISQDPTERDYGDGLQLIFWQSFMKQLWAGFYD